MKLHILTIATLIALIVTTTAVAQQPTKQPPKRNPNPAFAQVEDVPGLPRVLLIGDSISIGYTAHVRAMLKGVANVHRPLTNCGPTTRGLENIDAWLGDGKWDVIHFNWGYMISNTWDRTTKILLTPTTPAVINKCQVMNMNPI